MNKHLRVGAFILFQACTKSCKWGVTINLSCHVSGMKLMYKYISQWLELKYVVIFTIVLMHVNLEFAIYEHKHLFLSGEVCNVCLFIQSTYLFYL